MINASKMQKSVDLAIVVQAKQLVDACSKFIIVVWEVDITHDRPSSHPLILSTN